MFFIRTVAFYLFLIVFCILGPLFWLVWLVIRLFDRTAADRYILGLVKGLCRIGWFLAGTRVDARGTENIPDGAAVYALNHWSIFDIVIAYPFMKDRTGFIAKKSLGKIPFFSWWMKFMHCLFLDRENLREGYKTIQEGIDKVNSGISMAIFPEGTRNKDQEDRYSLLEFKAGAFHLAEKSKAPVVPVVVQNTSACMEDHMPWIKSANVRITFLPAIETKDMDRKTLKALPERVRQEMAEVLEGYRKEDEGAENA
ncbi:MAG: 1-acyl-sn-glycerol-3-phosphate acyltransferase [Lachnospiraceae bacterium]|nr:1-acyl-sn-glycerol-3-phosphate acyltransferase [Lachnospiraceae bacterium]